MKFRSESVNPPQDTWVWGTETLLWGYEPDHQYTLKILEPKVGRDGCLSLQYHHKKSETWFVLDGLVWALILQGDHLTTRIMRKGDYQNLPTGVIHRMMGLDENAKILESSTPDRHAADKSVKKDVVRLHCVHGRECEPYEIPEKQPLIEEAIRVSEEAIAMVEADKQPKEQGGDGLIGAGYTIPLPL